MLRGLIAAAALACSLLAPASAGAATVWNDRDDGDDRTIVYAGAGEANRVTVSQETLGSQNYLRVRESGTGVELAAGAGCTMVAPGEARCPLPDYFIVWTGDRDDSVASSAGIGSYLAGGSGDDTLLGSNAADYLDGQEGADTLTGGAGPDKLKGGTGADTVTYAGASIAIEVKLDGKAGDGAAGENDTVQSDVENVVGGSGDDKLTGNSDTNHLNGGPGRDTVRGEGGNDVLELRDGEPDSSSCGSGQDFLFAGPADGIPEDCETVTLANPLAPPPPGTTLPLRVTKKPVEMTPEGLVRLRVRCTRAVRARCQGSVTLTLAGRGARAAASASSQVLGGALFRSRPGRLATVKVRMSRNGRRRVLRRRRLRCRASVSVRLPSGATTTVRSTVVVVAPDGSLR
jgi:Ca2+-binding RTX toxin-like protein